MNRTINYIYTEDNQSVVTSSNNKSLSKKKSHPTRNRVAFWC